jgi:hypothetical protein
LSAGRFYKKRGPATSAGPTHDSVLGGVIEKTRFNCMNPAQFPPFSPVKSQEVEVVASMHDPNRK